MGAALSGGDGTEDDDDGSEAVAPDVVAKRFFEAQVAGDTEGMLDLGARHLMLDDDIAESLAVLDAVRDGVTLTNFSFTHLATGYNDERTTALMMPIL